MLELPAYNEKDYPLTEGLLALYDRASDWQKETGLDHRDLFRFSCQYFEDKVKTRLLEGQMKVLEGQIRETKGKLALMKAIEESKIFGG
jgi:hypothetical protein